jgi:hypothetical protein
MKETRIKNNLNKIQLKNEIKNEINDNTSYVSENNSQTQNNKHKQ